MEGYQEGNKTYLYSDLHVDNPNMERKERIFSTTGVLLRIDEDWFANPDVRFEIATGLRDPLYRDRSIESRDLDVRHTWISVRTEAGQERKSSAIAVYDGLRLSENLFVDFERYADKLVDGAERVEDDPLVRTKIATQLQEWARTLHNDSLDAVASGIGEVPEGWLQTYIPNSTVEALHNGAPTEVELIEPIYADFFGSGTPQLHYRYKDPRGNTSEPSPIPAAHGQVRPIGTDWGWTLWNPKTGEFRELSE